MPKEKIIGLSENLVKTLDFFIKNKPPRLDLSKYQLPFVVGSGNAYNTGAILFSGRAAILADESNFRSLVKSYQSIIKKKLIRQAVVISASGEKDSVWEVALAKKCGLKTTLLTCVGYSPAAKIADRVIVYPKIAEPYTYNTATYLGMVLSATGENPKKIKELINKIKLPTNFKKYSSYSFVLPDEYLNVCPMVIIKRDELFGSYLSIRAFPDGHARHAKFVNRNPKELVISLDLDNKFYGLPDNRWSIKLPADASFGAIIAITYFLVGQIQNEKPDYFRKNIYNYCRDYGPKAYGKNTPFDVIVPVN